MPNLPTLDAHAHINPAHAPDALQNAGAVLAMTLSLEEAAAVAGRADPYIVWGVGCHPYEPEAQATFDVDRFAELVERSAVIGEVGLDTGAPTAWEQQVAVFRQVLRVAQAIPRPVSIHSYRATAAILEELRRTPVAFPVLHWWKGTAAETRDAVALGCYFSVHPAIARHRKFGTAIPTERLLIETDLAAGDPPAAIPCRIEWVEHLLGKSLAREQGEVRTLAWRNFARIIRETGTQSLLPAPLAALLPRAEEAPTDGGRST